MKKRLFLYTTLIIFAGLVSFFIVSIYITQANNLKITRDTVMETAKICAGLYNNELNLDEFVRVGDDTRITVIASDGTVLADSQPLDIDTIETHLTRPEVQAAARGYPMAYVRYSETLGVDYMYYALKVDSGNSYVYIRTSIPVAKIDSYLYQSLPMLIILLCVLALACFFSVRSMTNIIIKPFNSIENKLRLLSRGEYTQSPIIGSYEEIDKITKEIDDVALVLQSGLNELRDEKNKMGYILDNMGDGLFVIDDNSKVALINFAALGIFNVTADIVSKNLNYLTNNKQLTAAVEDGVNHANNALFELPLNGSIFLVTIKRLPDTKQTMVTLTDVTENRENAKRREEFFTNASHELKTPLTAIKGFNELTSINNNDEAITKYIDSIARETDRMMILISNMLKLSELENKQGTESISIMLAKIINEVRETVSTTLIDKSITFEAKGDADITAEHGHIYELIKNLVENAVRYNNPGGKVSVIVESNKGNTRLTVSDNGIGISPKEQTRIFERFYRVEKSRSIKNGGTGLGLSIVKHICALYGWKLSLKSKLGVGTEVTIDFITI